MSDAATPAVDPLTAVSLVLPRGRRLADLLGARPAMPFNRPAVGFVENLGRALRGDAEIRRFPELVALGFWARAASIKRLQTRFEAAYPGAARLPRGLALHFAPSNVDTIFVYSLLLSMLAGNVNLVRISSRAGEQTGRLLQVMDQTLGAADPAATSSLAIIRYDHDQAVTDDLSRRAALRVVWGGDATVGLIRQSPLSPAGTELVFPNKYSLAVFDAAAWTAETDKARVARAFVNDTLWFGQMACASPRALVWRGTQAEARAAGATFWPAVDDAAAAMAVDWEEAGAVAKLVAEQEMAIDGPVEIVTTPSNRIRVVRAPSLTGLGEPSPAGGGFFVEHRVDTLDDLAPAVRRDWQTVVSHGIGAETWRAFFRDHSPAGIDRVVKVGSALDFDAIWDGVDLMSAMTRIAAVEL